MVDGTSRDQEMKKISPYSSCYQSYLVDLLGHWVVQKDSLNGYCYSLKERNHYYCLNGPSVADVNSCLDLVEVAKMNLGGHNVVDYSKVFHPKIWVYLELGSANTCLEMNQSCSSFLDYCRSNLYVLTSQACFAGETLETWETRGSFEIHLAVRNFYRVHQP